VGERVVRRSIQGMLEELEDNLWEHVLVGDGGCAGRW
jgi:hypothetical protein